MEGARRGRGQGRPDDGVRRKNQCSRNGRDGERVAVMTIVAPSNDTPPPEKGYFSNLDDGVPLFCVGVRLYNTYEDAQSPKTETPSINRYKKNA